MKVKTKHYCSPTAVLILINRPRPILASSQDATIETITETKVEDDWYV